VDAERGVEVESGLGGLLDEKKILIRDWGIGIVRGVRVLDPEGRRDGLAVFGENTGEFIGKLIRRDEVVLVPTEVVGEEGREVG